MQKIRNFVLAALCAIALPTTALAQIPLPPPVPIPIPVPVTPPAPFWHELDAETRRLLREHREYWNYYADAKRYRILGRVERLLEIPPDRLLNLERQLRRFRNLPLIRRQELCRDFRRLRGYLPPPCLLPHLPLP